MKSVRGVAEHGLDNLLDRSINRSHQRNARQNVFTQCHHPVANIILYQYSGDHHQNNGKDKPQTRNLGQIGMGVKLRGNYDKQAINQPENGCDHNHGDAQRDDNEETGQKVTTNLGSKPLEHAHI